MEAMVSEDCLSCIVKDKKLSRESLEDPQYQFLGIKDPKTGYFLWRSMMNVALMF